jgi:hypothetical protein
MDNYNLKQKYQEEFNNIIKLHTTNIKDIEDILNIFDVTQEYDFIYMYNNRNNIDNIDIEYINNTFNLFYTLNSYPLQKDKEGIIHFIFSMYYKLIYLLKIYNNVKNNPNSLYLYGGLELSTFNSDNLNIFILGELHFSNMINIPTNCIYIYELFELIIEYSIKTSKHKIHILLENVLEKLPFINNNNDDISNKFLTDSNIFYYYLNLFRKYLNLTTMDLDNINRFNSLLRSYNLNESLISNFVNNGLDRIEFHFIDYRNFMENLFKQTDIEHYDTTIQNNYLIFPDKFPNYEENKSCIKCFLKEIFDENGISIYRILWDELNLDQKTIDLINHHTNDTNYYTYLMDQIVILKYLYFKKRDENFTFIFFGGVAHGNKYTKFIQEYENKVLCYKGTNSFSNRLTPLPNLIDNINYNHNIINKILTKPAYKYNTYIYDYMYVLNEPNILQNLRNMYYIFDDIEINNHTISKIMKKFIDKRFIKFCKSNYTDIDDEEKLYGGANLQQQLIQKPILEKIEYYEMKNSVLFKGKTFNDIIECVKKLLDYSKVDINHVGGNINLNKWIKFLLF